VGRDELGWNIESETAMKAEDLLAEYARRIDNLDHPLDDELTADEAEEMDVFSVLHTRSVLMDVDLTPEQQRELARLDDELRARRAKIAPFLPPSNPPGREQWWWWLHEG
jgi:hypothetical protein